jgi:hypothetical protein
MGRSRTCLSDDVLRHPKDIHHARREQPGRGHLADLLALDPIDQQRPQLPHPCFNVKAKVNNDRFFRFEMVIKAARQNPCCIGDFMQRGVRAGAGDYRRCHAENLGASLPSILTNG